MASKRYRDMLIRQWQLVSALAGSKRGLTLAELQAVTGAARATVYRYLSLLNEAGVPLTAEGRGEGARHRLLGTSELPALGLTPLQIAALFLARQSLEPLTGTEVVTELDALLEKLRPPEPQQSLRLAPVPPTRPDVLKVMDAARRSRRRALVEYRAASRAGRPTTVHIEPIEVRLVRGEPYVRAYCVERRAERTYKLARITSIRLSDQRATYRGQTVTDAFAHSLKAWSGDLVRVGVRLDPQVGWLAAEYPLPGQRVTTARDGSVLVEAEVSGLVEAMRWVLGWGAGAEAVHPPELRQAVARELARAAGRYRAAPGPAKTRAQKSTARAPRRSHGSRDGRGVEQGSVRSASDRWRDRFTSSHRVAMFLRGTFYRRSFSSRGVSPSLWCCSRSPRARTTRPAKVRSRR